MDVPPIYTQNNLNCVLYLIAFNCSVSLISISDDIRFIISSEQKRH